MGCYLSTLGLVVIYTDAVLKEGKLVSLMMYHGPSDMEATAMCNELLSKKDAGTLIPIDDTKFCLLIKEVQQYPVMGFAAPFKSYKTGDIQVMIRAEIVLSKGE